MAQLRRAGFTLAAVAVAFMASAHAVSAQRDSDDKKPSLSLKANPPLGFSPLRVRVAVEVRGGRDDDADFYCAATEWDWGDGTISESSSDCEPYEAGKSVMRRFFSGEHVFRLGGQHKIVFRLKQKNKVVAAATANVQVRSGSDEYDR